MLNIGFSPKASGFYPFGDATALAREGGGIAKRLFLCFCFSPPQYLSTEPVRTSGRVGYDCEEGRGRYHYRPSPRLTLCVHCCHQVTRPYTQGRLHGVSHHLASPMPVPAVVSVSPWFFLCGIISVAIFWWGSVIFLWEKFGNRHWNH